MSSAHPPRAISPTDVHQMRSYLAGRMAERVDATGGERQLLNALTTGVLRILELHSPRAGFEGGPLRCTIDNRQWPCGSVTTVVIPLMALLECDQPFQESPDNPVISPTVQHPPDRIALTGTPPTLADRQPPAGRREEMITRSVGRTGPGMASCLIYAPAGDDGAVQSCREWALREGWAVVDVIEENTAGSPLLQRPAFRSCLYAMCWEARARLVVIAAGACRGDCGLPEAVQTAEAAGGRLRIVGDLQTCTRSISGRVTSGPEAGLR